MVTNTAVYCIKDLEEDFARRCPLFLQNSACHFDVLTDIWPTFTEAQSTSAANIVEFSDCTLFHETASTLSNFAVQYRNQPLSEESHCPKQVLLPLWIQATSSPLTQYDSIVLVDADYSLAIINSDQIRDEDKKPTTLLIDYATMRFYR